MNCIGFYDFVNATSSTLSLRSGLQLTRLFKPGDVAPHHHLPSEVDRDKADKDHVGAHEPVSPRLVRGVAVVRVRQ